MPDHNFLVAVNVDEGTVSLVNPDDESVAITEVGNEPTRVAATTDEAWVTTRLDGEVVALALVDGRLQVRGRRHVGAEPVGIVVDAARGRLFVAVSIDNVVLELDARTLATVATYRVPLEPRWLALHPGGEILAVGSAGGHTLHIVDLVRQGVHTARLDGVTELGTPESTRATGDLAFSEDGEMLAVPVVTPQDPTLNFGPAYYAPESTGTGAVVASIARFAVDAHLPKVRPTSPLPLPAHGAYASQVAFGPTGAVWASMIGAGDVSIATELGDPISRRVGLGPRGLTFHRGSSDPWVHNTFELMLQKVVRKNTITIETTSLSPDQLRGREMFYTSIDPQMTVGGISCATCHFEGRSDNHTWSLFHGPWQTPSLGGPVDERGSMTWVIEGITTVALEAELTITGPMGGEGLGRRGLRALADYVNDLRAPQPPTPNVDEDVLNAGKRAFAKAGCTECHLGDQYTDGQRHSMFGHVNVKTPPLVGIGSTAPYLHDGRASDLEELLTLSEGEMGQPEHLSSDERHALVTWLRSL